MSTDYWAKIDWRAGTNYIKKSKIGARLSDASNKALWHHTYSGNDVMEVAKYYERLLKMREKQHKRELQKLRPV